jgi:hypothetical protein
MQPPSDCPPRIRTDPSNPFAHHTMSVRVPAIVEDVLVRNPDYPASVKSELRGLRDDLEDGRPLPPLPEAAPAASLWIAALAERAHHGWLSTDWFFAENYAYRQIVERTGYWQTLRDPFLPNKREEYASDGYARALQAALEISGNARERLHGLLAAVLFANRIDLSFAASLERGTAAGAGDLVADDRAQAVGCLLGGNGAVHIVIDNAGTELTLDLVFADCVLSTLGVPVVLHLKPHPAFVSDATARDVLGLLGADEAYARVLSSNDAPILDAVAGTQGRALRERLLRAWASSQLELVTHEFWNGPESLWCAPRELEQRLTAARLVLLKGDAHYRRALNDAIWPPETPFCQATAYFPAPLLALRTLKSPAIVGVSPGTAAALDRDDPTWRVNGQRGVISIGSV